MTKEYKSGAQINNETNIFPNSAASGTKLIAECGVNWRDLEEAKEMIRVFSQITPLIKFQLYDVDHIFKKDFEHYGYMKKHQLSYGAARELMAVGKAHGADVFFSAFNNERWHWVQNNCKYGKIASSEFNILSDLEMYSIIRQFDHTFVSVPVRQAMAIGRWLEKGGVDKATPMLCSPKYPSTRADYAFGDGINLLGEEVGLSDHTVGIELAMEAIGRGVPVIEKHVCLEKRKDHPDFECAATPDELWRIKTRAKLER